MLSRPASVSRRHLTGLHVTSETTIIGVPSMVSPVIPASRSHCGIVSYSALGGKGCLPAREDEDWYSGSTRLAAPGPSNQTKRTGGYGQFPIPPSRSWPKTYRVGIARRYGRLERACYMRLVCRFVRPRASYDH